MEPTRRKELFVEQGRRVLERVKNERGDGLIVYHDDADGICAAAILSSVLEFIGFRYNLICVEKLFPETIKLINEVPVDFIVFADVGAGAVTQLSRYIDKDTTIYVIDHHDTEKVEDPRIINYNPEIYGLEGESVACGATVAYLVARNLGEPARKLAWMAVVGSAEIPGKPNHFNWLALVEAEKAGDVERKKTSRGESIRVTAFRRPISYESLNRMLTILASVGYYRDGPQAGVAACIFRYLDDAESIARQMKREKDQRFSKALAMVEEDGLFALRNVQWFDLEDVFDGMGTRVLGIFTSTIRYKFRLIHRRKYILGFMNMRNEIPGLGRIRGTWKKVSVRVPFKFEEYINAGIRPPVSAVIAAAAYHNGGYGDGHSLTGSGVIPSHNRDDFINTFDELAGETAKAIG